MKEHQPFQSEELPPLVLENKPKVKTSGTGPKSKKKNVLTGKKKPKKASPTLVQGDWNQDTRPSKYFDPNIDPKAKRDYERQQKERAKKGTVAPQTAIQVEKEHPAKYEVGFLKSNGQVGSKFEVYKDVDALYEDKKPANYASRGYSMKKASVPPKSKKLVSTMAEETPALSKGIFVAGASTDQDH